VCPHCPITPSLSAAFTHFTISSPYQKQIILSNTYKLYQTILSLSNSNKLYQTLLSLSNSKKLYQTLLISIKLLLIARAYHISSHTFTDSVRLL
jgi:hypothetical protein